MMTHRELLSRALDAGLITNIADDYAEPGYTKDSEDLPILFANWNPRGNTRFENGRYISDDMTMPRLRHIFSHYGYAIEWDDVWLICEECGKAFRCSGDSYSWTMYGAADESGCYCGDCIKADAEDYLQSLENDPRRCVGISGIDPADYGYVKLNEESYEHGLYGGQRDDPKIIAKLLRDAGVHRFLFMLDSVRQFDLDFSCYVHKDEYDAAQGVLGERNVQG